MRTTVLDRGWRLSRAGEAPDYYRPAAAYLGWIPAEVPGAVHLDLHRHGVIADPFARLHEAGLRWVDEADWVYRCEFDWAPDPDLPRQVFRFGGLDTVCAILLNGAEIARSDNMFVPVEVEATGLLERGRNALEIRFRSAEAAGIERRRAYFEAEGIDWQMPFFDERAFVRKAAYMSGWDWGPRFLSCGIWRPVELLEFRSRLLHASLLQERLEDGRFRIWADVGIDGDARVGARLGDAVRAPGEPLEFIIESPELWWPNGEGGPHLYAGEIFTDDGFRVEKRIGLRTIRLLREDDRHGRSFEFEVNGRRIWCRGANWIPNDSFPGRIADEEIAEQIAVCGRLGINMLRVWGGGLYESEAFYDACDAKGVLVWQDFPFACSYYPEDSTFLESAEAEVRKAVTRLRDRASLALWCGNNENSAMYETSWGGTRPSRFYGAAIYEALLPRVLGDLDPSRPYVPTSPLEPSDESRSDSHTWDVWHGRGDWIHYRESKSRFASEFGFASSCGPFAWNRAEVGPSELPRSDAVRWHDKTTKPVGTFEGFVRAHYPEWRDLEEWIYLSQLNQRDAFRAGIEHYRMSEPCRGALIWQFNDCWPVQSWAVQDYARLLKPAGFELARLFAPVLLSVSIESGTAMIGAANDRVAALADELQVDAISTSDGRIVDSWVFRAELRPGERRELCRLDLSGLDPTVTALRARLAGVGNSTTWRLLGEPKDAALGTPTLRWEPGGRIRVDGLAWDLVLWDEADPSAIRDPETGLSGWRAQCAANETLEIGVSEWPSGLCARSLAGRHAITLPANRP